MNNIIKSILNHASCRSFVPDFEIPVEDLDLIIRCAQQAPSWRNGQHYSIINITDQSLKNKIQEIDPLNYQINQSNTFLIFVGDLYRTQLASKKFIGDTSGIASSDVLITIAADVALATQNAIIASESLGYGTCIVGGFRNLIQELSSLLSLPTYTFPIFGLCIGKPNEELTVQPRLPKNAIYFENSYSTLNLPELMEKYDSSLKEFCNKNNLGTYIQKCWQEHISNYFNKDYLESNKFLEEYRK